MITSILYRHRNYHPSHQTRQENAGCLEDPIPHQHNSRTPAKSSLSHPKKLHSHAPPHLSIWVPKSTGYISPGLRANELSACSPCFSTTADQTMMHDEGKTGNAENENEIRKPTVTPC
ncbi:hypothetical protein VTJ04DRAFT_8177 [Mycothermus thermophilus]|uniref:uncharacterized protein n=1 Tax=Humicola insolens TaxID=85995 RepID=UPI003744A99C